MDGADSKVDPKRYHVKWLFSEVFGLHTWYNRSLASLDLGLPLGDGLYPVS